MCILCHHFTLIDFQSLVRHFDHIFSLYIKYPHLHFLANKLSINMRHLRYVLVVSERKTLLHFDDKRRENSFIEGGRFYQWNWTHIHTMGVQCMKKGTDKVRSIEKYKIIKTVRISMKFEDHPKDMLTLTHKQ